MIKIAIIVLIIWVALSLWTGFVWFVARSDRRRLDQEPLPSIADVQREIGATVDGKLGPETQRLWDQAYCNQMAAMWDHAYE